MRPGCVCGLDATRYLRLPPSTSNQRRGSTSGGSSESWLLIAAVYQIRPAPAREGRCVHRWLADADVRWELADDPASLCCFGLCLFEVDVPVHERSVGWGGAAYGAWGGGLGFALDRAVLGLRSPAQLPQ